MLMSMPSTHNSHIRMMDNITTANSFKMKIIQRINKPSGIFKDFSVYNFNF